MSHFEHRAIDAFLYASYNERYIYILDTKLALSQHQNRTIIYE